MKAVTASIVHEDAYTAGRQTAIELMARLGPSLDVVLVFATSRHAPERVLEGLWNRLPQRVRLLGCSSFAEIGDDAALSGSVTAMGIDMDGVEWQLFKADTVGDSSLEAGRSFGELLRGFAANLVLILSDGMAVNTAKFIRPLQEILGPECTVIGGVASEQFEFTRTFEFFDRQVLQGGVVALAMKGPIKVATAARAGFQPVGVERTCTRVEDDRLILELDGVSALGLYRDFLGPQITDRPSIGTEFPLALVVETGGDYMASDERRQVIRVVRQLDEERGALLCGSDVPEGSRVRMTRATKRDIITAASLAVEEVKRALPAAKIGFIFNCAGRRLVLGARYNEEIRAVYDALDPDLPTIGFYTYGEISPVDGTVMFHGETFTLALIEAP